MISQKWAIMHAIHINQGPMKVRQIYQYFINSFELERWSIGNDRHQKIEKDIWQQTVRQKLCSEPLENSGATLLDKKKASSKNSKDKRNTYLFHNEDGKWGINHMVNVEATLEKHKASILDFKQLPSFEQLMHARCLPNSPSPRASSCSQLATPPATPPKGKKRAASNIGQATAKKLRTTLPHTGPAVLNGGNYNSTSPPIPVDTGRVSPPSEGYRPEPSNTNLAEGVPNGGDSGLPSPPRSEVSKRTPLPDAPRRRIVPLGLVPKVRHYDSPSPPKPVASGRKPLPSKRPIKSEPLVKHNPPKAQPVASGYQSTPASFLEPEILSDEPLPNYCLPLQANTPRYGNLNAGERRPRPGLIRSQPQLPPKDQPSSSSPAKSEQSYKPEHSVEELDIAKILVALQQPMTLPCTQPPSLESASS